MRKKRLMAIVLLVVLFIITFSTQVAVAEDATTVVSAPKSDSAIASGSQGAHIPSITDGTSWRSKAVDDRRTDSSTLAFDESGKPAISCYGESHPEASIQESGEVPFDTPIMEGRGFLRSTGTGFEVTDSSYLNLTLNSTEPIHVILESFPRLVSFSIEPITTINQSVLTVSGFNPATTYYRYEDGYLVENFTNSEITFTQDLTQKHHVYFLERSSTLYVSTDFTFTEDIYEPIVVAADGITIDGNGYSLIGSGDGYGLYLNQKRNVRIRNVNMSNWDRCILLWSSTLISIYNNSVKPSAPEPSAGSGITMGVGSSDNVVERNHVEGGYFGISAGDSKNVTIQLNNITDSEVAIYLGGTNSSRIAYNYIVGRESARPWASGCSQERCSNNTVDKNHVANYQIGFSIKYASFNNTVSNNTAIGFSASRPRHWNRDVGFLLCSHYDWTKFPSSNSFVNNEAKGFIDWGFFIHRSHYNTLSENSAILNHDNGFYLNSSSNQELLQNFAAGNENGYCLENSSLNVLTGNNASVNDYCGFYIIIHSHKNNLSNSLAVGNNHGYLLSTECKDNTLWQNEALYNDEVGFYLILSSNNTLWGNRAEHHGVDGFYLSTESDSNLLCGNWAESSAYGFYLWESSKNSLWGNTMVDNNFGLSFLDSSDNSAYCNTFLDNALFQVWESQDSINEVFHPSLPLGNYWSDYIGIDGDSDGVGDSAYVSESTVDPYPLMQIPHFTQSGSDVEVTDETGVHVMFSSIIDCGITMVIESDTGPSPPAGFRLAGEGIYYEIITTSTSSGPVTVCIPFAGDPTGIVIQKWDDIQGWVDVSPQWVEPGPPQRICGIVTELSIFTCLEGIEDWIPDWLPFVAGGLIILLLVIIAYRSRSRGTS